MKRKGNIKVNQEFNPQHAKPTIPFDVDDVDAVLERFIRQKYDQRSFMAGSSLPSKQTYTRDTPEDRDQSPPLPPKPGRRFGFGLRSASSAIPLHFSSLTSPPRSPSLGSTRDMEAPKINKQSKVFGTNVGDGNDSLDAKLARLRELGFLDDKRNAHILKGLGGNIEKTVEQLIRLGEANTPISRSLTPLQTKPSNSNLSSTSSASGIGQTNGLSFVARNGNVQASGEKHEAFTPGLQSQQAPSRSLSPLNPYAASANNSNMSAPATAHPDSVTSIDQAFANMQIVQQPLFPNATGGYPNPPVHFPASRYQSMTPPVTQGQFSQTVPFASQISDTLGNTNPFFRTMSPAQPFGMTDQSQLIQQDGTTSNNPFFRSSATSSPPIGFHATSPQSYSPQPLSSPSFSSAQISGMNNAAPSGQYPFVSSPTQTPFSTNVPQTLNPFQQQQPSQPLQFQTTPRYDKTSILALYDYPHLAPQREAAESPSSDHVGHNNAAFNSNQSSVPQRSVTMPAISTPSNGVSKNPFQSSMQPPPAQVAKSAVGVSRHISQESVDIGGFQNGRHSPDAFASLSARYVR